MPSIYTQPTQSKFIPTYQPIPSDMMLQGLQQRQKKHEQNLAQLDALRSAKNQMSNYVFEEDQPVLDEKMGVVKEQLDRLAGQGDLSDAGRKVRDVARGFREEVQTGDVAKAFENFRKVQNKYKQIEDSDLSEAQKQKRKNAVIADYQGVGQGGLDLNVTTDDIDMGKYAEDFLSNLSPNKVTSFLSSPQGKNLTQGEKDKLQQLGQGEISVEQVPTETAKKLLRSRVQNDPDAQAGLLQRARVETAGMDTYEIDGEEVSRQKKMQQLMNDYIDRAAKNYAGTTYNREIDLTEGREGSISNTPGMGSTVVDRGVTKAINYSAKDFGKAYNEALKARDQGDEGRAEQITTNLDQALTGLVQSDKYDVSRDDVQFMKETREKIGKIESEKKPIDAGKTGIPALGGPEGAAGVSTIPEYTTESQRIREELGEDALDRYQQLEQKYRNFVEGGGGVTETIHTFSAGKAGRDAFRNTRDAIRRSNTESWSILGKDDTNSTEFLNQRASPDSEKTVLETFVPHGHIEGSRGIPARIKGRVQTPEGTKTIQLTYKDQKNWKPGTRDVMDSILGQIGAVGEQISEKRKTEHIRPGFDFKNVYDELTPDFKSLANKGGNRYVGVKDAEEGINVKAGPSEDQSSPITTAEYIANITDNAGKFAESRLEQLNKKHNNVLNTQEKEFILSGGLNASNLSDEEQQTKRSVMDKLQRSFNNPYPFTSVHNAIKAAVNIGQ